MVRRPRIRSGRRRQRCGPTGRSRSPYASVGTGRQREERGTMTTPQKPPDTALLVMDVQNGVVGGAHARDAVVANVGSLVEKARRERVPVVWVQHSDDGLARGSDDWRIVPELSPVDAEPLVEKHYGDSFEDT